MSEAMTRSMQCPSIMTSTRIVIVEVPSSQCHRGMHVVNGGPLQWKLAEGGLSLLVFINYIIIIYVCPLSLYLL